jgi:hypothetical protein
LSSYIHPLADIVMNLQQGVEQLKWTLTGGGTNQL